MKKLKENLLKEKKKIDEALAAIAESEKEDYVTVYFTALERQCYGMEVSIKDVQEFFELDTYPTEEQILDYSEEHRNYHDWFDIDGYGVEYCENFEIGDRRTY